MCSSNKININFIIWEVSISGHVSGISALYLPLWPASVCPPGLPLRPWLKVWCIQGVTEIADRWGQQKLLKCCGIYKYYMWTLVWHELSGHLVWPFGFDKVDQMLSFLTPALNAFGGFRNFKGFSRMNFYPSHAVVIGQRRCSKITAVHCKATKWHETHMYTHIHTHTLKEEFLKLCFGPKVAPWCNLWTQEVWYLHAHFNLFVWCT